MKISLVKRGVFLTNPLENLIFIVKFVSALLMQKQWYLKQPYAGVRTDSKMCGQTLKQEQIKDTREEDNVFTQGRQRQMFNVHENKCDL